MRYSLSLMIDPDLHTAAKRYAFEHNISFARLVAEALLSVLEQRGAIDSEIAGRVEERIAKHPGRRRLATPAPPPKTLMEVYEEDFGKKES